jgi:hypothetical protein
MYYIFNSISSLITILKENDTIKQPEININFCFEKKIILREIDNKITIWKSNVFINYPLEDVSINNIIANVKYKTDDNIIKILYLILHYNDNSNLKKFLLEDEEILELKNAIIRHIENIAKSKNKKLNTPLFI